MKKVKISYSQENLIRSYLIWCYKTTKEDLDRIDRYFTQVLVDRRLLDILLKGKNESIEISKVLSKVHI